MADTLFRDLSEHNEFKVDQILNRTTERVVLFRSNDGTYCDKRFADNLHLASAAANAGKLDAFGVYFVFEENWQETLATFKKQVGTPNGKMFVVIDVESWGGRITGDHSKEINACRRALIAWLVSYRGKLGAKVDVILHRQRKRVLGYGNSGDLLTLWVRRGNIKLIVAAYGSNPAFPNRLAHQFLDSYTGDGLPAGDINSADGLTSKEFAAAVGCQVLTFRERVALFAKKHNPKRKKRGRK
jgi:hypothetical protein